MVNYQSRYAKWGRCVLHVAQKNDDACNVEHAWTKTWKKKHKDTEMAKACYNPYSVCRSSVNYRGRKNSLNLDFSSQPDARDRNNKGPISLEEVRTYALMNWRKRIKPWLSKSEQGKGFCARHGTSVSKLEEMILSNDLEGQEEMGETSVLRQMVDQFYRDMNPTSSKIVPDKQAREFEVLQHSNMWQKMGDDNESSMPCASTFDGYKDNATFMSLRWRSIPKDEEGGIVTGSLTDPDAVIGAKGEDIRGKGFIHAEFKANMETRDDGYTYLTNLSYTKQNSAGKRCFFPAKPPAGTGAHHYTLTLRFPGDSKSQTLIFLYTHGTCGLDVLD